MSACVCVRAGGRTCVRACACLWSLCLQIKNKCKQPWCLGSDWLGNGNHSDLVVKWWGQSSVMGLQDSPHAEGTSRFSLLP